MDNLVKEAPPKAAPRAAAPTVGGSVYVKPQDIAWSPTQFAGISIKVLYEDKTKGEMTCLLKWEPGATLPMHKLINGAGIALEVADQLLVLPAFLKGRKAEFLIELHGLRQSYGRKLVTA